MHELIREAEALLLLKPALSNAWLGGGNAHYVLKHYGEAIAAYEKAIALKSDLVSAWLCHGNVFFDLEPLRRGVGCLPQSARAKA